MQLVKTPEQQGCLNGGGAMAQAADLTDDEEIIMLCVWFDISGGKKVQI